eukprot:g16.t1
MSIRAALAAMLHAALAAELSHWPLAQLPVTRGGALPGLPTLKLTAFGAVADGRHDNAPAFAAALAQLAAAGGGTLVVPRANATAGGGESVYATMPLRLRVSRFTLRLERGVRLAALCDVAAWPTVPRWPSFADSPLYYAPFVHALNVTDLAVEGEGTIDGNGPCFWRAEAAAAAANGGKLPYERPRLLVVQDAQRVSLANFTTTNSSFWNLVLFQSDDVHVDGVRVRNPSGGKGPCPQPPDPVTGAATPCYGPNADGIDLVSVRRALVERMDIVAGDDGICVKSGENAAGRTAHRPSAQLVVRDNFIRSCSCPHVFHGLGDGCGAMKVGTEMSGGVSDVLFERNTVGYAGIALKLTAPLPRGGAISNVTWRGIDIERTGMAVQVQSGAGGAPRAADEVPDVSAVAFENVAVRQVACLPGTVDYGCGGGPAGTEGGNLVGWLQSSNYSALRGLRLSNFTAPATGTDGAGRASPLAWLCSARSTLAGAVAEGVRPPVPCL